MSAITLLEAISQGLAYELSHDENVIIFGEDVGKNGGVFRATNGLKDQFGADRVVNTPLAESMIAGIAVGMATQGLRPVAEFQFSGFIHSGLDHIMNHAGRMRNRTRGRLHCPIVYRMPFGGGIHAPEHHSESLEALLAHTPGLRVVIPSSPLRAYGLLLAAIRNPDPVIFMEPKRIYRALKQTVPDDGKALPLDQCFVLKEGADLTLISWGAMLQECIKAADQLQEKGLSVELIDLATIKPMDMDTILNSVEKTGRCAIVHEAVGTCGVGAEIAAQVAEKAIYYLKAPIKRITGFDVVMPYAKLEKQYMPSVERIVSELTKSFL